MAKKSKAFTFALEDIEGTRTHSDAKVRGQYVPVLKVKVYSGGPSADEIMARLGCNPEGAQRAAEIYWESACEGFWRDAQDVAKHHYGDGARVYSAGRSSGYLYLRGGPGAPEDMNRKDRRKWRRFAREIEGMVNYALDLDRAVEEITANEWADVDAEQFNFIEGKDGKTRSVADLKRAKRKAEEEFLEGKAQLGQGAIRELDRIIDLDIDDYGVREIPPGFLDRAHEIVRESGMA